MSNKQQEQTGVSDSKNWKQGLWKVPQHILLPVAIMDGDWIPASEKRSKSVPFRVLISVMYHALLWG